MSQVPATNCTSPGRAYNYLQVWGEASEGLWLARYR
jgi:hypothetical protein